MTVSTQLIPAQAQEELVPSHQSGEDYIQPTQADLLTTIFEGQRQLMHRYHEIEENNGAHVVSPFLEGQIDDRVVQMRLKDLAQRMVEELCEATSELKNRPWKQSETPTNVEAFHKEVADVTHYFVEFCITAGITPEMLHRLYFQKKAENVVRQDTGY